MNRLVAIALLSAFAAFAQTNRGAITGTVTDQSQSVVPGANITITNTRTNDVRKLTSSQTGTFTAADLDPVTYRVEVELKGFKKSIVEDVKVDTASTATVNISLQTGAVDTQVTVSAETAMLNVDSGTTSSTVTEREIQDVPLLNRSVLDLALTLPNVSGDGGSENPEIVSVTTCPGCNLSVGGGRPLNTSFMADGTNNTGVSLSRTMVSFSPETVQEFTVQTTAYSAEYGTTGGGIISATTKSGSNEFNGTALWYNRNPAAAASPFTQSSANRPQPTLKSNQFSLAAGGPVWIPKLYNGKNKTFWFAAFEPNYRRNHLDQYGLLPTDGMRSGDFSGLVNTPSGWLPQSVVDQYKSIAPNAVTVNPSVIYQQYDLVNGSQFSPRTAANFVPFPGNVIPKNMLDATAIKTLPLIVPASTYYLNSNGLISNIFTPRLLAQDEKRFTIRIDHNISESNRINARWTSTPIIKIQGTAISPTTNGAEYSWAKQAMLAFTHTFSPTTFNDLRLNYTRGRFSTTAAPEYDAQTGSNLNTILGLPNLTKGGVPLLGGLFPGSSVGGGGSTATGLGSGGSTSADDKEERYAITDILYKNTGAMSWKFGVDMSHSLQNVIPLFAALGGSYAFASTQTNSTGAGTALSGGGSAWASYMLGVANGNITLRNTEIPYYYRWEAIAGFVQNDWKIKRNFTLNLGVRYSLQMPRTEKYDNQGVYHLDMSTSMPLPTPLTLINGEVIKNVLVPDFVFSGRGNSRYLTPTDYHQFEPRIAFAWSPAFLQSHHVTLRGGYGLSHAPVTGATRLPNPDFGATSNFATTVPSVTANPNYVMRLGENPPVLTPSTPAQAIAAPANGIVSTNSLYYQQGIGGYAVSANYHTPYVQNWNLTVSWQATGSTSVELSYVGAKGTHLFLPHENVNFKDQSLLNSQIAANVSTTATIADPLGRRNPFTNNVLTVQNGTLGSPYLGFSTLYVLYDSAANSIRHAGYVNVIHRARRGLTFTANYTWAKSIDDASSAGGDKNILTPVGGQTDGQIAFGGTRANDRSVSTYDQRHVLNGTYIYDLPFGKGRQLMNHSWKPLEFLVGGWTMTGTLKRVSGFPYMPYLSDTNQLGDVTHTARPDLAPGVPIVNPLWDRNCPTGTLCQPYVNPSAFSRPTLGVLGSAPRTLDGVRGPWSQFFSASIQKNFAIGDKRRLQFRVDALNVFNHPVFAVYPNNAGGADFMGAPVTTPMTAAEYDTWANPNNQPLAATAAGAAILAQVNANIAASRNATGILPPGYFNTKLPGNFYGTPATSYDIRTVDGYKNFRLRNAYATNFGTLYNNGTPRYLQFGVKLYF